MPPFTPTDVYDRFLFNTREQVIGEPVDVFVNELKTLSQGCKYEGASEEHLQLLIRDRFIIGMRDKNVQYELLQYESSSLPLEKAVELAKEQEEKDKVLYNKKVRIKTEVPDDTKSGDDEAEGIGADAVIVKTEDETTVGGGEEKGGEGKMKEEGCENQGDFDNIDRDDLLQLDIGAVAEENYDEEEEDDDDDDEDDEDYYGDFKDFVGPSKGELEDLEDDDDLTETRGKKSSGPKSCMLCKEEFTSRKKLNAHLRTVHKQNEKQPVNCEDCGVKVCNVYKLKQHMFRRHRRIFDCSVCKDLAKNKSELRKHIETKHKIEMSTMCLICKKTYTDKYALKCHMKRLHGDLLGKDGGGRVCRLCDETVPDLKKHMETKHDDTGMKCKICNKQLRQDESLRMHFIQMHSKAGKTVCQYCGDSFANIDAHVATLHMTEKPYKCDKCDYSHATKVGLKNHKLYFHPKGNAHMCHMCPYKSHHKSNLKQHIQVVHEKEKPFQCPQCDKSFFHKGAMNDHVNVQHENKLHNCSFCNKSFKNKPAFKLHVRSVHQGIWEHCNQCNGRFQDKGDLRRHIRNVHDRDYAFKCEHCSRGFPYRKPLRDHMLKHHGIAPTVARRTNDAAQAEKSPSAISASVQNQNSSPAPSTSSLRHQSSVSSPSSSLPLSVPLQFTNNPHQTLTSPSSRPSSTPTPLQPHHYLAHHFSSQYHHDLPRP